MEVPRSEQGGDATTEGDRGGADGPAVQRVKRHNVVGGERKSNKQPAAPHAGRTAGRTASAAVKSDCAVDAKATNQPTSFNLAPYSVD